MDATSINVVNQQCPANKHREHFKLCEGKDLCDKVDASEVTGAGLHTEVINKATYCGYETDHVSPTPAPTPGVQTFDEVLHLFSQPEATVNYAQCVSKAGYTTVPADDFKADDKSCHKARCKDRSLDSETVCYSDDCTACKDGGVCTCKLGLCKTELDQRVCTTKAKYKAESVCPDQWSEIGSIAQESAFTTIVNDDCMGLNTCDPCSTGQGATEYGGRCVYNTGAEKNVCLDTKTMHLKL